MIAELESLIRAGKFDQVKEMLGQIKPNKAPREEALALANFARRVGQLKFSLQILNPIVRPKKPNDKPASVAEKIEYAEVLRRLGITDEAQQIFQSIDLQEHPQVQFHLALCFFSQWEYGQAIPLLRSYLKNINDGYAILVGQVNLAAALILENQLQEARELLIEIKQEALQKDYSLLYGNSLELSAQLEVSDGKWDQAVEYLNQANQRLEKTQGSTDSLFVTKWRAIVESLKEGVVKESLLKVREQSISMGYAETWRDCDFYIAKIRGDIKLFEYLYFGTPFLNFRQRIEKCLPPLTKFSENYLWFGENNGINSDLVFNLTKAELEERACELPVGQALHRFVVLLSRDFYKPLSMTTVFSCVFPGEYYDPNSSPNRVYLLVKRLRKWLATHKIPVKLTEMNGAYRFTFTKPFGFRVPKMPLPLHQKELEFLRLKSCLNKKVFSAKEAKTLTKDSTTNMHRLLTWAMENEKIQSLHEGPKRVYKILA